MSRFLGRASLAAAASAFALTLCSAPGSAATDPSDGGLWYVTQTGMAEAHQRTTGEGVRIAVIDSPVNTDVPELRGSGVEVREPSYCAAEEGGPAMPAVSSESVAEHGTSMVSIIAGTGEGLDGQAGVQGVAPGATVAVYAALVAHDAGEECARPGTANETGHDTTDAFRDAVAEGADIISVSGDIGIDYDSYVDALRAGVIVVGAGGNDGGPVTGYPATMNGAVGVGTVNPSVELDEGSPTGPRLGVVAPGSDFLCLDPTFTFYGRCTGSSNAAAYTSGALALVWSAYPSATSNQILQSLVRNTDGTEHEPRRDDAWGYGAVNVRQMLASDPTAYPDENPFIAEGPDEYPPAHELLAAGPGTPTPSGSDSRTKPLGGAHAETSSRGNVVPALVVGGSIAGFVLVAGVVTLVVLNRRRAKLRTSHSTASPTHPGGQHGRQG